MLRRRTRTKPRRFDPFRVSGHLKWIRGFVCTVPKCNGTPIEAHHVTVGVPWEDQGGMGRKVHDKWTCPLCPEHHAEVHRIGQARFEAKYDVDLLDEAKERWAGSPHRYKHEQRVREAT